MLYPQRTRQEFTSVLYESTSRSPIGLSKSVASRAQCARELVRDAYCWITITGLTYAISKYTSCSLSCIRYIFSVRLLGSHVIQNHSSRLCSSCDITFHSIVRTWLTRVLQGKSVHMQVALNSVDAQVACVPTTGRTHTTARC